MVLLLKQAIEKTLGCEFMSFNLDKENFNIHKLPVKYLDIKQLSKKH